MDKAKITFLGTGSAIPTAKRNHPAVLLQYNGENLLFDCGEGTQRQFRVAKLNPCKINKIFLSHWHGDHVLGLPGLLQTLGLNGYNNELKIYGPQGSKRKFQEMVAPHLAAIKFEISIFELEKGVVLKEKDFMVEAVDIAHGCKGLNYSFIIRGRKRLDVAKVKKLGDIRGPVMGELAAGKKVKIHGKIVDGSKMVYEEPERKVSLIFDTKYKKSLEKFVCGSDLLISEATYFDDVELATEHYHMTAMQAVELAKKSKSKKLLLFHFSQRLEAIMREVDKAVKKAFKESVLCRDFDSFEF
jgi:ribonuclease Z